MAPSLVGSLIAARAAYLLTGRLALRVVPPTSDDLRRVGYAHLEGSAVARAAQADIARQRSEAILSIRAETDPEATAASLAAFRRAQAERSQRAFADMTSTAEGEAAILARCDAYLQAAIDGVRELVEPVPVPCIVRPDALPATASTEDEPMRLVADPAEESATDGRLCVRAWGAPYRIALGLLLISHLQEAAAREVASFRR